MKVKDSVFAVAGGASGLGEATVRRAVASGARVGIVDLPTSAGAELAKELGGSVVFQPADVRSDEEVEAAITEISQQLGELDVAVCTAGIVTSHRMVKRNGDRFPAEMFRRTIEINLIGTFNVARAAVGSMLRKQTPSGQEAGVIINTSSIAAFDGQRGQIAYTASKAAVAGLCLPLARDLGQHGIRVMAIAPGIMGTKMLYDFSDDIQARLVQDNIFPPRAGHPQEYASLVCSIVENQLLNGETIRMDAAARLQPG